MSDSLTAQTITIAGANGDDVDAYVAQPAEQDTRGGVVVIHHTPGYDRASKETVRRFATLGFDAVMPNLYWRQAPGEAPAEALAKIRALGGVSDDQLLGDVAGAAAHLRSLPNSNGKVGVIGYCSGGRQATLSASHLDLDAVVDCYGAFIVKAAGDSTDQLPDGRPLSNLEHDLPGLSCPVLGLFGNDDQWPSPARVDELEELLKQLGKTYEFHRYDGAGHAFFWQDSPNYRVAAANDGWLRVEEFFSERLRV